jgi:hypothetical protein
MRRPAASTISISGCWRASHTGGVAVGVHRITFMPFCAASATFFSSQSNWYLPSSGSMKAHANSPMWTYSMPSLRMLAMSRAHWLSGHASG